MSPKLPRVNSRQLIRALKRAGFEKRRQRGSHLHLRRASDGKRATVPVHKGRTIPVGTLQAILRDAGISVEEFRRPIEAISAEARREKSIRKGHIPTLHLWWVRRPLVAVRAAVYGALVPAPVGKRTAREAADFVADLCKYPGPRDKIAGARRHILEAHA